MQGLEAEESLSVLGDLAARLIGGLSLEELGSVISYLRVKIRGVHVSKTV